MGKVPSLHQPISTTSTSPNHLHRRTAPLLPRVRHQDRTQKLPLSPPWVALPRRYSLTHQPRRALPRLLPPSQRNPTPAPFPAVWCHSLHPLYAHVVISTLFLAAVAANPPSSASMKFCFTTQGRRTQKLLFFLIWSSFAFFLCGYFYSNFYFLFADKWWHDGPSACCQRNLLSF